MMVRVVQSKQAKVASRVVALLFVVAVGVAVAGGLPGLPESKASETGAVPAPQAAVSSTPSPPRLTLNLLGDKNYSFESARPNGQPEGWSLLDQEGCSFTWPDNPSEAYHEQRYVRLVGTQEETTCVWQSPRLDLGDPLEEEGRYYFYSGRVKAMFFEEDTEAYLSIILREPYKRIESEIKLAGNTDDWEQISGVVQVPENKRIARVEVRLKDTGTLLIDFMFLGLDIDLNLWKTSFPNPVTPGDSLTYLFLCSNLGMEPARNVVLHDAIHVLEPSVTYQSADPMPDNPEKTEWDLGTISYGPSTVVSLTVGIEKGIQKPTLVNTATLSSLNHSLGVDIPISVPVTHTTTIACENPGQVCFVTRPNNETALPGETVPLAHTLENCGPDATSVAIAVDEPDGWTKDPDKMIPVDLDPGQQSTVTVNVTVPDQEAIGSTKNVVWRAVPSCGGTPATITDTVRIADCGVCFDSEPNEKQVTTPGYVRLGHTVRNCGTVPTSVTVSLDPPSGWGGTPSQFPPRSLAPDATYDPQTLITVPEGERLIDYEVPWTAVAACGDIRTTTDTVHVKEPHLVSIPLLFNSFCFDPVGPTPCSVSDPYEPNHLYCSTRTELESGVAIRAALCSELDSRDFYYLNAPGGATIELWLQDLPDGTDYDLYFFYLNSEGALEFKTRSTNPGTTSEYIRYIVPSDEPGQHFVSVHSHSGWSTTKYTLRAQYP
jgi:uncharacterized repeat protein (TIGR01451 family)